MRSTFRPHLVVDGAGDGDGAEGCGVGCGMWPSPPTATLLGTLRRVPCILKVTTYIDFDPV